MSLVAYASSDDENSGEECELASGDKCDDVHVKNDVEGVKDTDQDRENATESQSIPIEDDEYDILPSEKPTGLSLPPPKQTSGGATQPSTESRSTVQPSILSCAYPPSDLPFQIR